MDEQIRELLEKQARWQKRRQKLSWAEKVQMIEKVKEDFAQWLVAVRKPTSARHEVPKGRT